MTIAALRGGARAGAIVGLTLALLALYGLAAAVRPTATSRIVRAWYVAAVRLAGIRVRVHGAPLAPPGALLVANHVSYMDILAIGTLCDSCFVAKSEVRGWPLIGWLARLTGTIFAERERTHAHRQIAAIAGRLARRRSVVVFPEGTTSRGRTVLPFKSALFEAARGRDGVVVQPISIAYAWDAAGLELTLSDRMIHPWTGQATLVPHLWSLLKHRGAVADVVIGPAEPAARFASRKALAAHCHAECARGLAAARRRPAAVADGEAWLTSPIYGLLG